MTIKKDRCGNQIPRKQDFTLISLQINQKLGKLASFMYFVEVAKKQETRDKKYECVSWFHYHK